MIKLLGWDFISYFIMSYTNNIVILYDNIGSSYITKCFRVLFCKKCDRNWEIFFSRISQVYFFFPLINRLLNIGVLCGRRDQIDHRTTSKSRSFLNFLLMCVWFLLTLISLPYFIEIDNLSIYTSISFFGISIFLIYIIILYICIII